MKTKILFLIIVTCFSAKIFSQNPDVQKKNKSAELKNELYQFYLTDPAIKIMEIQYEKDCTPVKGKLSENGKTIFIEEYTEHSRVYLKYLKADGKVEEITKSPCFIDPVVPAL